MSIEQFNNKGFSLIEVLVAMLLIGIIGAALSTSVFVANKASMDNNNRLQGLFFAQEIIEDIRAKRDSRFFEDTEDVIDYLLSSTELAFAYNNVDDVYYKIANDTDGRNYSVNLRLSEIEPDLFLELVVEVEPEGTSIVTLATRILLD